MVRPCAYGVVLLATVVGLGAARSDVALIEAVKRSDARGVQALVEQQVDVNAPDATGATALHWAVHQDDLDSADLLIRAGAEVNTKNRYGVAPLALACMNANAEVVRRLLEAGAEPNTVMTESGETVLMLAARTGQVDAIEALLAHGANVNAIETTRRQTPLMWAVAERHVAAAQTLITHGADPNARSKRGLTPLMFAVRAGDIPVTRVLLAAGANLTDTVPYASRRRGQGSTRENAVAADEVPGTSVLVLAILNAHYELAAFLLEHGADPNVPDPRGSALHVLAWMRRATNVSLSGVLPRVPTGNLDSLAFAEVLLEYGANPNIRLQWVDPPVSAGDGRGSVTGPQDIAVGGYTMSFVGATPFFVAASNVDAPLMQLLAAHGADSSIPTRQMITPLMAAAGLTYRKGEQSGTEEETLEAVTLAYELGNDPNAAADFGDYRFGDLRLNGATALHGAAVREVNAVVEFLLEKGTQIDAKTEAGWTALTIADGVWIQGGYKEQPLTAALLRQRMVERGLSLDNEPPPQSPARRDLAITYIKKRTCVDSELGGEECE